MYLESFHTSGRFAGSGEIVEGEIVEGEIVEGEIVEGETGEGETGEGETGERYRVGTRNVPPPVSFHIFEQNGAISIAIVLTALWKHRYGINLNGACWQKATPPV